MVSIVFALIHWVVSGFLLLVTSAIVPGFRIKNFSSAMVAAAVIGLLNFFVRPLLDFVSLPLNFLTFGLFTFVITAVVLKMAAALMKNFEITSWLSAIMAAVVLAFVNSLLFYVLAMLRGNNIQGYAFQF
jgi:putative membrane protein